MPTCPTSPPAPRAGNAMPRRSICLPRRQRPPQNRTCRPMSLSFRHRFARRVMPGRAARSAAVPYHADLDTPILMFGKEAWCARDAFEHVSILGAPGAGKSSSSFRMLAAGYFATGCSALALCYKSDAADDIRAAARLAGRTADLVFVNDTAESARINLLDVAGANVQAMTRVMIEAGRRASGTSGGDGENRF